MHGCHRLHGRDGLRGRVVGGGGGVLAPVMAVYGPGVELAPRVELAGRTAAVVLMEGYRFISVLL